MDLLEAEIIKEKRKKILSLISDYKLEIDTLINRGFFKQLLLSYQDLSNIPGLPEWIAINSHGSNCSECDLKKLELLEGLIFQMSESKLLDIIKQIKELDVE